MSKPEFLSNYDVFANLTSWKSLQKSQRRHWSIAAWGERGFECALTWVFGGSQLGSLRKYASNPYEAVYLALSDDIWTLRVEQ